MPQSELPYKVEVQADSDGTWAGNGLTFESIAKAETYALDLFSRWTAVREWRVIDAKGTVESDSLHYTGRYRA